MSQPFACSNCLVSAPSSDVVLDPNSLASSSMTFPLLRSALIASFPSQQTGNGTPLALWAPHNDLSSALIEFWAYVGDVIGMYNRLIMFESFLVTAQSRRSLGRLGDLLGYRPRPAVAAIDEVAAFLSRGTFTRLSNTSYRAPPSAISAAQAFEADEALVGDAARNEFVIRPVRRADIGDLKVDGMLLEASTASAIRGRPVLFSWLHKIVEQHATEITGVAPEMREDGQLYVRIDVVEVPIVEAEVDYKNVAVMSPSQRAYAKTALLAGPTAILGTNDVSDGKIVLDQSVFGFLQGGHGGSSKHSVSPGDFKANGKSQSSIELDSVYRSITAGDRIIVQYNAYYSAHIVTETAEIQVEMQPPQGVVWGDQPAPFLPITRLTVNPAIDSSVVLLEALSPLIIHYNMYDIGRLMRPAYTELTPELVLNKPLPLEGIHDRPTEPPTEFILEDANGRGVLVKGELKVADNGSATLQVTEGEWTGGLRVPVKAYGNVVRVSRGETVKDEVLGDGDQSRPFQSFQLGKSPLTYLPTDGAPGGSTSTLEVRVDGILWHERPSFYGARPNDAIYIVRHDDDQNTIITFGDGIRGRRLSTGSRNVRASYRFGAGAEVPPPGGIEQIIQGGPGLLRVRSPIQARGGGDAENMRDIRRNAPASALILGRCVSLADFTARVAGISGVRNSKVEYAWDEATQSAAITVWYIPSTPDADLSDRIVPDLQAMSEPGLIVRAKIATPVVDVLFINVEIDRDYLPAAIEADVRAALLDPEKGLLALENTPIGGPLSRSALVAAAKSIPGVLEVTSVAYGLQTGPNSFPPPGRLLGAGEYFDFSGNSTLVIGAVLAESRGCRDLIA